MSSSSLSLLQYLRVTMAALREDKRTDTELLSRFAQARDEIAFAALVVRHGQMVWSVCRQILGDTHDVEDAFQAAFMSLSHKANKIHIESLAGWLHQVARQAALDIQKSAGSRRKLQEQLQALACCEPLRDDAERNETYAVLHEELDVLSEKLRVPLVLHYLEGKTQVEIAQIVGISERSVRKRLERGKSILQERLSQRGVCVGMAALATFLEGTSAQATISSDLIARTVGSSLAFRAGTLSGATAELARQVLKSLPYGMGWVMKTCLAALLCVGGLGAGAYVWRAATILPSPRVDANGPSVTKVKAKSPQQEKKKEISQPRVDVYGDPLPPHALTRLGTVRFRPGRDIQQLEFTPDGKALLTRCFRPSMNIISLWDKDTGKLLRQFGDSPNFCCASIDAQGHIVAGWQCYPDKSEHILCLWEVATGKLLRQFKSKSIRRNYAISPNGKFLAADLERKFAVWDISTGMKLWAEKLREGGDVEAVVISPDSSVVASSEFKRDKFGRELSNIRLWETRTGKLLRTWEGDPGTVCFHRMQFSSDGNWLIAQSYIHPKNTIHLMNRITGKVVPLGQASGVACSPAGTIVATYMNRAGIWLWDMTTGKVLRHLPEFRQIGGDRLIVFSPDGKILAGTTETKGNIFWDVATGKVLRHCQNSKQTWGRLAFSPDGKILAGMEGPALSCWEVATGKKLPRPRNYEGFVDDSVAFNRDGKSVVSVECNEHLGVVHIWDAQSGQERSAFPSGTIPRSPYILKASVSPDNKILAFGRGGKAIDIWDAVRGQKLQRLEKSHKAHVISSDRQCLIYGYEAQKGVDDFMTILWELATGRRLPQQFPGIGLALSPDGTILVTKPYERMQRQGAPGVCYLWEMATGKKMGEIKVRDSDFTLAFSPNRQALLITDSYGANNKKKTKIQQYPLYRDKQLGVHIGVARTVVEINGGSGVNHLTCSPDGKMLAASERDWSDGSVYLWETATGKERGCFQGHTDGVKSLSFSPDSRRLASGSADTTILIWDITGRMDDQAHLRPLHLSAKQQEECWTDLAGADAIRANHAIWTLVAAGQSTVAFLAKRLRPVPNVPAKTLTQLIADLDSETFTVRQKARKQLEALGELAEPSLRQALEKQPSLELRRSADHLLALVEEQRAKPSGETLRMLRAIEVLEQIGTPEARKLLEALSAGAPGARQTEEAKASVNRLARRTVQP